MKSVVFRPHVFFILHQFNLYTSQEFGSLKDDRILWTSLAVSLTLHGLATKAQ